MEKKSSGKLDKGVLNKMLEVDASLIVDILDRLLGFSKADLTGKYRGEEVIRARVMAYHLLYHHYNHTYARIGAYFNRDHATVLHAAKQHDYYYSVNFKNYARTFRLVKAELPEQLTDKRVRLHKTLLKLNMVIANASAIKRELVDLYSFDLISLGDIDLNEGLFEDAMEN